MNDIIKKLVTLSFEDYNNALSELRNYLDSENEIEKLSDASFFFILRPYCWFLHDPGFQDILDSTEDVLQVLLDNKDLLMEDNFALHGDKFMGTATFLANYADVGNYDTSGWQMLFGGAEIAVHLATKEYAEKLDSVNSDAYAKLIKLSDLFYEIEGSKHLAYYVLRHLAADYIPMIESLIHKFPEPDQTYVLHAFDQFGGNIEVIEFYKRFIETTAVDYLKEEAQKYLERVDF